MSRKTKPSFLLFDPDSPALKLAPLIFGETPVTVKLLPEKRRSSRGKRMGKWLFPFISALIILVYWWVFLTSSLLEGINVLELGPEKTVGVGYTAPKYIILHKKNTIEVTIKNTEQEPLNGSVTLVFSSAVLSISGDGKASFELKNLLPDAQITKQIGFVLHEKPDSGCMNFRVIVQDAENNCVNTAAQNLKIAPYSMLHKFILSFVGPWVVLLFPIIVGVFVDRLKG